MRALIVPRQGAEPGDHWYGFVAERVAAGTVPGLSAADVRAPTPDDVQAIGSLVLLGHDEGTAVVQDFIASLPAGHAAAGTLLVAPPSAEGDWHAAGYLRVLLSDDSTERDWAKAHGAEVAIRVGGKRFYGDHEIAVLINLAALALEVAEEA